MQKIPRTKTNYLLYLEWYASPTQENKYRIIEDICAEHYKGGGVYLGVRLSQEELCKRLNIPPYEYTNLVYGYFYGNSTSKLTDVDLLETAAASLKSGLGLSARTILACQTQVNIYLQAQNGKYKPFISDSTLKAIEVMLKAQKQLTDTAMNIANLGTLVAKSNPKTLTIDGEVVQNADELVTREYLLQLQNSDMTLDLPENELSLDAIDAKNLISDLDGKLKKVDSILPTPKSPEEADLSLKRRALAHEKYRAKTYGAEDIEEITPEMVEKSFKERSTFKPLAPTIPIG